MNLSDLTSLRADLAAVLTKLDMLLEHGADDPTPGELDICAPTQQGPPKPWADASHWPAIRGNPNFQLIQQKTGRMIRTCQEWQVWGALLDAYPWREVKVVLNDSPGQWPDFYLKALAARKKSRESAYA